MNENLCGLMRQNLEQQRKDAQAIKKNLDADMARALEKGLAHSQLDWQRSHYQGVIAGIDGALALLDMLERQDRLEREVEADYLGEALAERHADKVGIQDPALNRYWISYEDES